MTSSSKRPGEEVATPLTREQIESWREVFHKRYGDPSRIGLGGDALYKANVELDALCNMALRAAPLSEECMGHLREILNMVEQETSYAASPRVTADRLRPHILALNARLGFKPDREGKK